MSTPMNLCTGQIAIGSGVSANPVAAVAITCGFQPKYVRVVAPKASKAGKVFEWFYGMTAAHAVEHKEDTGYSVADITSNGITVNARGFTIGTGCQIAAADPYRWIAFG